LLKRFWLVLVVVVDLVVAAAVVSPVGDDWRHSKFYTPSGIQNVPRRHLMLAYRTAVDSSGKQFNGTAAKEIIR
jgi:hypothetical protein